MGAFCGCDGTFHFPGESENVVVEFGAVTFMVLPFGRAQLCAKSEKAGAEPFAETGPAQLGG